MIFTAQFRNTILFISFFIFLNQSYAQKENGGGGSQAVSKQQGLNRGLEKLYSVLEDKSKRNVSILDLNNDIEGTPYFNEEFVKDSVYFDNTFMGTLFLRYDAYADEIQIKKS